MSKRLWTWLVADLTGVLLVFLLPVSELLENNPYFKFKYGFEEGTLALIVLFFAVVPWLSFACVSFLAARHGRPGWRRWSLLVIVILYVSQGYSTGLQSTDTLVRIAVSIGLMGAGSWLALSRPRDFTVLLAAGILLAGPYLGLLTWRHWWTIPKPPSALSMTAPSTAPGDLFFIMLDGSTITSDYLDADSYPDAEVLPNVHRFVREDSHWFPNSVSNAPITSYSLPIMLTGKLHPMRPNNYLANEENLFSILDSRYEIRAYLFTKSCFCRKKSFDQCYPFEPQGYGEPMGMLIESFAHISTFGISPLSFPIGKLNDTAYDREAFVEDFLDRVASPASQPRLFAIQLFEREEEELRRFDAFFGELIEILRASGRYENATIALVSDHGFNMVDGEPEYGFHAEQTRRLYKVPFAIKPPGTGAGTKYDYVAQGMDIMPTLLGCVGTREEIDGRDLDGVDVLSERPDRVHYFSQRDRQNLYRFRDGEADDVGIVAVPVGDVFGID